MMNYSFPTINPEIWDKYIAPAGLKALETGVNLPVVKQGLEGIEAIHRRGVVPVVSRALEPLPFEWQETGPQEDKAWWDRVAPNFDQYITPEGSFSPSGVFEQVVMSHKRVRSNTRVISTKRAKSNKRVILNEIVMSSKEWDVTHTPNQPKRNEPTRKRFSALQHEPHWTAFDVAKHEPNRHEHKSPPT